MRDTIRRQSLLTALTVASIAFPTVVAAQKTPEALEQHATGSVIPTHDVARAAGLLVRAAQIRGPADPLGVTDLTSAANAYFFSGKPDRSRELFVQAADRALAMGDVDRAARAFLLAAIVANRQGDVLVRDSLITRAGLLASSPLLSSKDRQILLQLAPVTTRPATVVTVP